MPSVNLYLPYGGKIIVILLMQYMRAYYSSPGIESINTLINESAGASTMIPPTYSGGSEYDMGTLAYNGVAMGLSDGAVGSNTITGRVSGGSYKEGATFTILAMGLQR